MTLDPELIDIDTTETTDSALPAERRRRWLLPSLIGTLGVLGITVLMFFAYHPPAAFPTNTAFTVRSGEEVRSVVNRLEAEQYTRSEFALYLAIVLLHDPRDLKASTYVFTEPLDTLALARRLTEGDYGNNLIRFTHIEGQRIELVANRAADTLANFDTETFLELTAGKEGRLFPDTYFIPPDYSATELATLLEQSYMMQLEPYQEAIAEHPLSEWEIIILASILEREANSRESMRIVSGILQSRLAEGMPLQADATIEYAIDTPLNELPPGALAENLRELQSPYNTYLNQGLPPTPIGNPGITAIEAVLDPELTAYRFYLTAADGSFHYAETYDGHLDNIEQYLR